MKWSSKKRRGDLVRGKVEIKFVQTHKSNKFLVQKFSDLFTLGLRLNKNFSYLGGILFEIGGKMRIFGIE